ncbi:MAG: hypothetical protein AAGJ35_12155, partial [Myxococcota bacterium]
DVVVCANFELEAEHFKLAGDRVPLSALHLEALVQVLPGKDKSAMRLGSSSASSKQAPEVLKFDPEGDLLNKKAAFEARGYAEGHEITTAAEVQYAAKGKTCSLERRVTGRVMVCSDTEIIVNRRSVWCNGRGPSFRQNTWS